MRLFTVKGLISFFFVVGPVCASPYHVPIHINTLIEIPGSSEIRIEVSKESYVASYDISNQTFQSISAPFLVVTGVGNVGRTYSLAMLKSYHYCQNVELNPQISIDGNTMQVGDILAGIPFTEQNDFETYRIQELFMVYPTIPQKVFPFPCFGNVVLGVSLDI